MREDIKLVVRSQKYSSLQEAINAASAEKCVKGPVPRANNSDRNDMNKTQTQKIQGYSAANAEK